MELSYLGFFVDVAERFAATASLTF